jgi:serine/threonine-protein kinase HipA
MRLAAAAGIAVPLHGLVYSKDGSLTYFIKRFDRVGKKKLLWRISHNSLA